MRKALRYIGWGLAAIVVLALIAWFVAYQVAMSRYDKEWTVHTASFPIPFPLTEQELTALRAERVAAGAAPTDPLAGVDLNAVALERAIVRGRHLVESRTSCNSCHAQGFRRRHDHRCRLGRPLGRSQSDVRQGQRHEGFTANDWDRAVRHGVRRNGRTSSMPSQDFVNLSDHELSDIVAYIRSMPPVDRDLGPVKFGPVFSFLIATEPKTFVAATIDHDKAHSVEPPAAAPNAPSSGSTSCRSAAAATDPTCPAASSRAIPTCRSSPT